MVSNSYSGVHKTPLDFCQIQFRQSGEHGPSCTMQACGGLTPKAHEYCEVQRDAGKKSTQSTKQYLSVAASSRLKSYCLVSGNNLEA